MRNPLSRGLAAAALTAALTFTLQAADGVTEINQALIEASGGFPYEITQPGSYLLTGNLTVPDADTTAIRVEVNDVTLDLNGFAIIGPVQCAFEDEQTITCDPAGDGFGVPAGRDATSTAVRNGSVRGMGATGVSINSGRVEGVRVLENGNFGIVALNEIIVRGCLAELNGAIGIFISAAAVIEHSIALRNPNGGIVVAGGVVRGNVGDSIFVVRSAVLGNWIENDLDLRSSGYADNVIGGVVTVDAETQPIGCNLIGGNLVCPEGSAAQ